MHAQQSRGRSVREREKVPTPTAVAEEIKVIVRRVSDKGKDKNRNRSGESRLAEQRLGCEMDLNTDVKTMLINEDANVFIGNYSNGAIIDRPLQQMPCVSPTPPHDTYTGEEETRQHHHQYHLDNPPGTYM
jgi:hypothetical protein